MLKPKRNICSVVADWEERLSVFLRQAIDQPHMEPEICEELIEYVQFLVQEGRAPLRKKSQELIKLYLSPRVLSEGGVK